MPNIFAAHALSEFDTVGMEWKSKWNGNAKPTVVKTLKNNIMLLTFVVRGRRDHSSFILLQTNEK